MTYIHLTVIFGLILFTACFLRIAAAFGKTHGMDDSIKKRGLFCTLFFTALLIRLIAAGLSRGFGSDTACFAAWADRIFLVGPGNFYSPDVFTDYPPGYMYLLYPIGALRSLLKIEYYSAAHLILLKLPSILCDLGCGWLLWREARKKVLPGQALLLCTAYLFNPAVILNSSVWGQVDSVFTFALACMCISLVHERLVPAYVAFFAALLIKPQALFLLPILGAAMVDQLILRDFSKNNIFTPLMNLLRSLAYGILSLCAAVLLCAPFGLEKVWEQYFNTVASYPYAAVNACNFWGLAGLNWISQDNTFMGLPYSFYGYAMILAAVLAVFYYSLRHHRDREKYPMLSAFLLITVFIFSVRMHERYLYPAMLFLLFAYLYRPSWRLYFCYGAFSLLHFYNAAYVLFFYDPQNYDRRAPIIILVSLGILIMACFLYQTLHRLYGRDKTPDMAEVNTTDDILSRDLLPGFLTRRACHAPRPSSRGSRLRAADFICILAITGIYSCFALYDLGDRQAPTSVYKITGQQTLTFDFGENIPCNLSYYIAPWHKRSFFLEGKRNADDIWISLGDVTLGNVFTWQEISIQAGVPYLQLTLKEDQASLLELVFLDSEGNVLTPLNASDYPELFDEQRLYPGRSNYRNSMYFDEIYHGRTAYEFLHGLTAYENTHPPLGKILIAVGISVFGMNPFGWRIVGVLFGIAMVPFVYLFARKLTDRTSTAALACVLFSFDFMHLTQTRIATIDVYITFFVILMYFFMYCYCKSSFYDTPLWKTFLPLGACGICMGLGIATKWTGIYAGAGLAVLFFGTLYRRYQEYCYAKADPQGETSDIPHSRVLERFVPCTIKTVFFCICFFVVIPATIYLLSYLPFRDYENNGLFARMLQNQVTMFNYHSTLDATHPYSSPWYQWPIIARPIWYFSGQPGETLREGISAFGNPLVWWAGIPAFLYMLWRLANYRDRTAAFLTIGYLAQYLPWMLVTRITFIYHYFPSVVFVVLMIVYGLMCWQQNTAGRAGNPSDNPALSKQSKRFIDRWFRDWHLGNRRFLMFIVIYGLAVFGLFLMFYPVLTGQPVEAEYVSRWLRWFDSWVLTAR